MRNTQTNTKTHETLKLAKTKQQEGSTTVCIGKKFHHRLVRYCRKHGLKVGATVEQMIKERLKVDKSK